MPERLNTDPTERQPAWAPDPPDLQRHCAPASKTRGARPTTVRPPLLEHDATNDTMRRTSPPGWPAAIERTVTGLGYELVDVERAPRGLLRVTIDRVPGQVYPGAGAADAGDAAEGPEAATGDGQAFVTVEDCERVTRQLQYALEVEGVSYERLEVSSPGLDRPLKRAADFERFAGQAITLTLKQPFQGRKHWKGTLEAQDPPTPQSWRLVFDEGQREQALDFALDEVREARLVPVLDFKGRGRTKQDAADEAAHGKGGARRAAPDGGRKR